eukprot:SAG11_NODE_8571_length_1000_cov_0.652608_1_plen_59_part_10
MWAWDTCALTHIVRGCLVPHLERRVLGGGAPAGLANGMCTKISLGRVVGLLKSQVPKTE